MEEIKNERLFKVTPYAGVWIEIARAFDAYKKMSVTPYAGVWIEIPALLRLKDCYTRHSLRGSVD